MYKVKSLRHLDLTRYQYINRLKLTQLKRETFVWYLKTYGIKNNKRKTLRSSLKQGNVTDWKRNNAS